MPRKQKYPAKTAPAVFIRSLSSKNAAQEYFLNTMKETEITFGVGPAGTGKTLLAAYVALEALLAGEVEKIILTRPIVATEDIGFLPGTMEEKIHPYILPLLDSLEFHIGAIKVKELRDDGRIQVEPLAFLRGRSLNSAFIILDEAQNTNREQMRMFLTRLGYDSKMVITGDLSQSDLDKRDGPNGLQWAVERLTAKESEIAVCEFAQRNIVRNPLIEKMLKHLDGPTPRNEEKHIQRHSFYDPVPEDKLPRLLV
jgi:phosphate starvation-inducible PhoH-like protein